MGLKNYPNDDVPLRSSVNDAKAMAEKLAGIGASVTLLTDEREDEGERQLHKNITDVSENGEVDDKFIMDKFKKWTPSLQPGDVAFVCYSGHGEECNGVNYVIPSTRVIPDDVDDDYSIHLQKSAINVEWLMKEVDKKAPDVAVLFFDCCRRRHIVGAKGQTVKRGMGFMNSLPKMRSGTLVGFACNSNELANDGRRRPCDKNSPYTAALVKFLGTKEDIRMDLGVVRDAVLKETARGWPIKNQEPCYTCAMSSKTLCMKPRADAGPLQPGENPPPPTATTPADAAAAAAAGPAAASSVAPRKKPCGRPPNGANRRPKQWHGTVEAGYWVDAPDVP